MKIQSYMLHYGIIVTQFLQLVANKLNISPIQIKQYSKDFKFIRMLRVDRIKFLYKYPLFCDAGDLAKCKHVKGNLDTFLLSKSYRVSPNFGNAMTVKRRNLIYLIFTHDPHLSTLKFYTKRGGLHWYLLKISDYFHSEIVTISEEKLKNTT